MQHLKTLVGVLKRIVIKIQRMYNGLRCTGCRSLYHNANPIFTCNQGLQLESTITSLHSPKRTMMLSYP